ncbi:MAG TPA: CDP-diacylglycerol--glycerol-3-phosphate 3-phosphatidyltransferase [Rhodospirillales bacterium]|nr:CDP-diacylglycerol--glycerol-3-phosphate 3-phosphatidyltransferase [Rhodospirillales bacterium]
MGVALNLPIAITLVRIALIPILVLVFYLPVPWSPAAAALVFALGAVSDWLDGYLARRLSQTSPFGAFLDPVADKLMVAVALVLLVQADPTPWLAVPAAVIVGREIVISALREWMAEVGKRAHVAVSLVGKFKTGVQMAALLCMLYRQPLGGLPVYETGFALLYVAAGLTLWSMVMYLRAALAALRAGARGTASG